MPIKSFRKKLFLFLDQTQVQEILWSILKKASNALNVKQCNKERNCIENHAAKLLVWINACNHLTVLHLHCVSWLCCELETIDIYIYALFYYREVHCIGSAMRHVCILLFTSLQLKSRCLQWKCFKVICCSWKHKLTLYIACLKKKKS